MTRATFPCNFTCSLLVWCLTSAPLSRMMLGRTRTGMIVAPPGKEPLHALSLVPSHALPFLPDDFKQKYRSVWVDVPSTLYDPEKGHWLYNQYLDQLEFADSLGYDGICVNEHHQNAYGLMPSPNLMGAALTRRTSKAALVVMGNSIALYNPPVRVAEEFAMLDVMSGGRLVAGFQWARRWTPISATVSHRPRCGTSTTKPTASSSRPGRAPSPLVLTGSIRSCAT